MTKAKPTFVEIYNSGIHERGQDKYLQVVKQHGGGRLRITVRCDSYRAQSHAQADVWSRELQQWSQAVRLTGFEMQSPDSSPNQPRAPIARAVVTSLDRSALHMPSSAGTYATDASILADADTVRRIACAIVGVDCG